jgi:AcrR family transcriptional regulator
MTLVISDDTWYPWRAMSAVQLGRREHQKLETRDLLVETGLREFAAHGLDAPSIRGICARAGLTRGAFYIHFRDREDFFLAVMERALRDVAVELPRRGVLAGSVSEMFERATRILEELSRRAEARHTAGGEQEATHALRFHHLLAASDRSAAVRARFRSILDDARARLARVFSEAQARGELRDDLSADDLANHFVTHVLGVLASTSAGIPVEAERSARLAAAVLTPPPGVGADPDVS